MQKVVTESIDEEKIRLERTLAESQKEYNDIIKLNDDLESENSKKDLLISKLDLQFKSLVERHLAEILQLELEKKCLDDEIIHESDLQNEYLNKLQSDKER